MDASPPKLTTYHSHPQHRQDKWVIEDVFKGMRNGYFVEAGAGGMSNTLTLESDFGWTGLAVEPHPARFLEINHRRCILENVCLTDTETEVEFVINHAAPGTSGIRSALGGGIREQFYADKERTETIRVKGYPLWSLLSKHKAPQKIDYLSLDVEGAEWLALKNFPFDEYQFGCMTIERGADEYYRLRSLLLSFGYRLVRVAGTDDHFVHRTLQYRVPVQDAVTMAAKRIVQPVKERARKLRRLRRTEGRDVS